MITNYIIKYVASTRRINVIRENRLLGYCDFNFEKNKTNIIAGIVRWI